MEVTKIVKSYEKRELNIIGATLLTKYDYTNLPAELREYRHWWWLRTKGVCANDILAVNWDGSLYRNGRAVLGNDEGRVRPALKLKGLSLSDFKVGDQFLFGGIPFTIITDRLAFCTKDIGACSFQTEREHFINNNYADSAIRVFIDTWFERAKELKRYKIIG